MRDQHKNALAAGAEKNPILHMRRPEISVRCFLFLGQKILTDYTEENSNEMIDSMVR